MLTDQLQLSLDSLHEWETLWWMSLSTSKCHLMHVTWKRKLILKDYTIKSQTPNNVDTAIYQGYSYHHTSPRTYKWKSQQNSQLHQTNCHHILLHGQSGSPQDPVWPQMKYSSCITDLHTQLLINKLERGQHHVACWIIGEFQRMASVIKMMAKLGNETLEVRRSQIRLAIFYKSLITSSPFRKPN